MSRQTSLAHEHGMISDHEFVSELNYGYSKMIVGPPPFFLVFCGVTVTLRVKAIQIDEITAEFMLSGVDGHLHRP